MANNIKKPTALLEIQKILSLSDEVKKKSGEMVFEEGKEDMYFYIVLSGNIEITKKTTEGTPKVIAQVGPGEFLAEGVLSGVTIKPASARAITDVTLMAFSYDDFEVMSKDDPHTAIDFLLSVLEASNSRLSKTNTKLMALYEVSQLLNMYRDDLKQLASGLINKLLVITDSKDGILLLKNPFSEDYRVIHTTSGDLNEQTFDGLDLSRPQKIVDDKGQFLVVDLKGLGILALGREPDHAHYDDDQLRLLVLIGEQVAHTIDDASRQAAEKAKKMLERKTFEL